MWSLLECLRRRCKVVCECVCVQRISIRILFVARLVSKFYELTVILEISNKLNVFVSLCYSLCVEELSINEPFALFHLMCIWVYVRILYKFNKTREEDREREKNDKNKVENSSKSCHNEYESTWVLLYMFVNTVHLLTCYYQCHSHSNK